MRPRSLAARLVVGHALVILAGASSLALVALVVAPGIYRRHVRDALGVVPADVTRHLDEAFQDSILIALGVAIIAASIAGLTVSWLISVRVAQPILDLADVAQAVTRGDLDRRVTITGADELRQLGSAFNVMADALAESEYRRRALFSDVSHELRTPLATLEGYVEGLADGVVAADMGTWTLLLDQTRRLSRLVDDLNTLARADAHQLDIRRRPLRLGTIVEAATAAAQRRYDEKQVALRAGPAPAVTLTADSDRLAEVLGNVLDNALRHTPPGGRVTLDASADGVTATIAVTDTGEGVAAEELDRIFDRFHRVDGSRTRATGGSGLGLAISRALVRAHGGTIHAGSTDAGSGLAITVRLPL